MTVQHLFRTSVGDFVDGLFDLYLDWEAVEERAVGEVEGATERNEPELAKSWETVLEAFRKARAGRAIL